MGIRELVFLAAGLSMDAFAASVCRGLSAKSAVWREALLCGVWFGLFQALMPVAGWMLGAVFAEAIEAVDHYAAFFLLALIGVNMIREAFGPEEDVCRDFSPKTMLCLALATSIDALAAGITLAMTVPGGILGAAGLIGLTTAVLSAAGVGLGRFFGARLQRTARLAGGIVLIGLGIRILWTHLGGSG